MSFGNMRQMWPPVSSVVSWTWRGQDGDSEALKARCSISRSHLVFCSGSFPLLFSSVRVLQSLLSLRHLSPALFALSLGAWSLFVTWPA